MVGLTILKRAASASMHSNASFFISQNGAQIPSVASCIHMHSSFKTLKTLAPYAAFSPSSRHFPSFNIPPAERSLEILSGESFWARKFGYFSGEGFKRQQRFRQIRSFWRHRVFTERETEGMERVAMNSVMGEIHLIVGPMFAGKTTALIRRMQSEIQMGRTVVLVKSDKDTRYGTQAVVSHDGAKLPCWSAPDLASFKARIGEEIYKKVDVIGIDEAQFFKDLYNFCQVAADKDGKILIVAGLDGDYLRKSFGSALDLIPLADSVVKLKSRCEICGKAASFTFRKTGDRSTEVIGGADIYMPVCRQHYLNGQLIIDATRAVLVTNVVEHESPLIAEVVPSA